MIFHAKGDEHFTALLIVLPPEVAAELPAIRDTHIYVMYLCRVRIVSNALIAGQMLRAVAAENMVAANDPDLAEALMQLPDLIYPTWLPTPSKPFAIAIEHIEQAPLQGEAIWGMI